jgi:hypothetical protein
MGGGKTKTRGRKPQAPRESMSEAAEEILSRSSFFHG